MKNTELNTELLRLVPLEARVEKGDFPWPPTEPVTAGEERLVLINPDPKGRDRLTKMFEMGHRRRFGGRTVRGDSHVGQEPESRKVGFAFSERTYGWISGIGEPDEFGEFEMMDYGNGIRDDEVDHNILQMTPGSWVFVPPSGKLRINSTPGMPLSVTSVFANPR